MPRVKKEISKIKEFINRFNGHYVTVLGQDYIIHFVLRSENKVFKKKENTDGYCCGINKTIVIDKHTIDRFEKEEDKILYLKYLLRHELIHAFLYESGLNNSAEKYRLPWTRNEEMVDWIALQSKKIFNLFNEYELLDY